MHDVMPGEADSQAESRGMASMKLEDYPFTRKVADFDVTFRPMTPADKDAMLGFASKWPMQWCRSAL